MANFVFPAIEKGIPIPEDMRGRFAKGPKAQYPWREMVVGDSFFSPHKLKSMESTIATVHRRMEERFTARAEGLGSRVWRVA